MPNFEKIGIMIREFDFLVEGASRGKAINEISKIELYLHENEDNRNAQSRILAENYSKVSIFVEMKRELIDDRKSENWNYLFTKYFSIEDIYNYFHKEEGASSFFRRFRIFKEMMEINYYIKLMDYLQSQIELFIPLDEDREIPYKVDTLEFTIYLFQKMGLLDTMKEKMKEHYYVNGSKLLTTMLGKPTSTWKSINNILWDIDHNPDESIITDKTLEEKLREILFHYKIDLR